MSGWQWPSLETSLAWSTLKAVCSHKSHVQIEGRLAAKQQQSETALLIVACFRAMPIAGGHVAQLLLWWRQIMLQRRILHQQLLNKAHPCIGGGNFMTFCYILQLLVGKKGGQGVSSPAGARVSAVKQQAEAAGSSKKEATASAAAPGRVRLGFCV